LDTCGNDDEVEVGYESGPSTYYRKRERNINIFKVNKSKKITKNK
jgi:hypothetical protein